MSQNADKTIGRVAGKVALVTGAAQGLGAATARLLAREGAAVLLTDLQESGAAVAAEIVAAGGRAAFLAHDATDEAAWAAVIGQAQARFGGLHILVNNAGIGVPNRNPETASLADYERMMDGNMKTVFLGTRAAIPLMRASGGGSIVNLSSIHGLRAAPHHASYGAAKGAVRLYTKAAAVYCAQAGYNIRCNSVHPGFIDTPMLIDALRSRGDEAEQRRLAEARIPMGGIGRADDIAWAILYLASDESRYVTGIELPVDGGYSAV